MERNEQNEVGNSVVTSQIVQLESLVVGKSYAPREDLTLGDFDDQIASTARKIETAAIYNARSTKRPSLENPEPITPRLEKYVNHLINYGGPKDFSELLGETPRGAWRRRAAIGGLTAIGLTLGIAANNIFSYGFNYTEGSIGGFVLPPRIDRQLLDYIPRLVAEGERKLTPYLRNLVIGNAIISPLVSVATILATGGVYSRFKERRKIERITSLREKAIPSITGTLIRDISADLFPPESYTAEEPNK